MELSYPLLPLPGWGQEGKRDSFSYPNPVVSGRRAGEHGNRKFRPSPKTTGLKEQKPSRLPHCPKTGSGGSGELNYTYSYMTRGLPKENAAAAGFGGSSGAPFCHVAVLEPGDTQVILAVCQLRHSRNYVLVAIWVWYQS